MSIQHIFCTSHIFSVSKKFKNMPGIDVDGLEGGFGSHVAKDLMLPKDFRKYITC